ncbi:four helix bundle protein [Flavobacterium sp. J372]|uniref:four helix bundle protein n=1 Tax=Flavobacterium sp. J372 TaxID=2898436 RepID=UPI0027E29C85|nr:four helix bundle protein [Flavobacterium sp. J372]
MHRFKDLEVWKQSRIFCSDVYSVTSSFPESEKFGLTNQLRRAAVSIPSNIAEGASRSSSKDFFKVFRDCYWVGLRIGNTTFNCIRFKIYPT